MNKFSYIKKKKKGILLGIEPRPPLCETKCYATLQQKDN